MRDIEKVINYRVPPHQLSLAPMSENHDDGLLPHLMGLFDLREPEFERRFKEAYNNLPRPLTDSERQKLRAFLDRKLRLLDRVIKREKWILAKVREGLRWFEEGLPKLIAEILARRSIAELVVSSVVIPEARYAEGVLIKSTSLVWNSIVRKLGDDWGLAHQIPPEKWEELVAGAYTLAGYNTVLTPRSGDHGRDVIAVRTGVGCVKIIGSVKAYRPGHLVGYDDVRSLLGVMSGERDASKGIITTTSDFPPQILKDPFIAPFVPYRLELMNGEQLQKWLTGLLKPS